MTARITARRVVLDLALAPDAQDQTAIYGPEDEGEFNVPQVVLSDADFRALGEPEQITVTIEPGDRLNEYDDERQAVAHWLDRNYGPATHAQYGAGHDWLAAADDLLEVAHAARPATLTAPATPPVGAGSSGGAAGSQIVVHESGLGDAIRKASRAAGGFAGSDALADRADALEAQITSVRELAAELTFKGKGEPDDMPDEFELARDEIAYMIRKRLGDAQ